MRRSPAIPLACPLVVAHGDHDLAAALVGDAVLGAEAVERLAARDAVACLERARQVVEAGVHDAAVVSGLVGGHAILGLEHRHRRPRALGERQRGGQADDAAADDGDVAAGGQGGRLHGAQNPTDRPREASVRLAACAALWSGAVGSAARGPAGEEP